jgi:hypothetical protein
MVVEFSLQELLIITEKKQGGDQSNRGDSLCPHARAQATCPRHDNRQT